MQWGPPEFQRSWSDLAANLAMDAPAFGKKYVDGAYWSLAVEVKFYFYVFLARALLVDKFRIGILIVAFASLLPLGDTWAYSANRPWWPYFLLGIGGWYAIFEKRVRVAATLGIASVVLYCVVRPAGYLPEDWLVHAFIWGAASSMLLLLWKAPSWSPPPVRWMARVGSISYSLYLLHQYIGVTIISMITERGFPDLLAIAVAASAVCCIAYVSFEYVEKPGNRALMRVFRAVFSGGEPPAKGNGSVTSATDMELPARANVTSATVEPAGAPLAEFAVARCDRSTRPSLS